MDVESVLAELTLEEKCSLLTGADFWHIPAIERLGIEAFLMSDGPHGLRMQKDGQADNLGINESAPAICYPTASAAACTFDIDLIYRMGEALGDECRAQGVSMILGPGVNMKRSPLCGRNFEYYSEDPYLAGHLGASFIRGVQSRGVGTSLKHFCANNQEKNRLIVDSVIDDRALHEIYLRPFEIAVRTAQPWTLMTAYNLLNGVYCSENDYLMQRVARERWGFEGAFVTDWGALNSNTASLPAGLDLVMPGPRIDYRLDIRDEVLRGSLTEAELDRAVRKVLELLDKRTEAPAVEIPFDETAGLQLARTIASESAVLLENDGILPLDGADTYAVIGAFAESPRYQGAGSSKINPIALDCALEALDEAGIAYAYEPAYDAATGIAQAGGVERAIELASQHAVAVVFVGLPDMTESEGSDRETMDMPYAHRELVERITAVNPRTVVVVQGGSPVSVQWRALPAAVLLCYLGGCQGGHALVDILFGKVNPSGKLAETWPLSLEDTPAAGWYPAAGRQALYVESIYAGYRFYDTAGLDVAYPFGYGLSYTAFEYRNLVIDRANDKITISCDIINTGTVPGKEVVQLYVAPLASQVFKASQQLKGFEKVSLEPGGSTVASFTLISDDFAHFDPAAQAWCIEAGDYELRIAASSRDVRLTAQVDMDADAIVSNLQVPEEYHVPRTQGFTIDGFKVLYGRPLPRPLTAMRPYTINATIGDLKTSTLGKIVLYFIGRELKNFIRDDSEQRNQLNETIHDIPLRNVAMSGIDMAFVYGIVDILNYRFIRGIRKILSKREE